MSDKLGAMSWDLKKSYNMDSSVFYCLVILTMSETFRDRQVDLQLEPIPEKATIEKNIAAFLGPRAELIELMTT